MGQSCISSSHGVADGKGKAKRGGKTNNAAADDAQKSDVTGKQYREDAEENKAIHTVNTSTIEKVQQNDLPQSPHQFDVVRTIEALQHTMKPTVSAVSRGLLHEGFRQFTPIFAKNTAALSVASCQRAGWARHILAGGEDCSIALANYETGHVLRRWVFAHKKDINAITRPLPSGLFATCSRDKIVKAWKMDKDDPAGEFTGHTLNVSSVDLHPGGNLIVSGSKDNTVRVWDVATEAELFCGDVKLNVVHFVRFMPALSCVVQGGEDLAVRVWDLRTDGSGMTLSSTIEGMDYFPVCCETIDTRPHSLLTGHNGVNGCGSYISEWDLRTGKRVHVYEGHTGTVSCLRTTPERVYGAGMFFSASDDNSIGVWSLETDNAVEVVSLPSNRRFIIPEGRITSFDCEDEGDLITAHSNGPLTVFRPVKKGGFVTPTQRFRYIGVMTGRG